MGRILNISARVFILAAFLSFGFGLPYFVQAESHDIYVDEGFDGSGNGSKNEPFNKIGDAIKKAKSKDKIYIFNGQYDEDFTIPAKVSIHGESSDGVVIKGSITAKNDAALENVTVSGGNRAIFIEKDASVTVSKSIIRDAARIGIDISIGNGKVIVKNSKIYNNGKGFYIQGGNRLELTGNSIYKNREEAVDIRENVDGFIQGNEIYENGESGIEVILGGSNLVISGNSIRNNQASGIATQYYEDFNDDGVLSVKNNNIKKNSGFGLRCDMPQKGSPGSDYWDRSMALSDNVFGGNAFGQFSEKCRLTLNKSEIADVNEKKDPETPQETALAKQKELEESQGALEEAIKQTQESEIAIEANFNDLEAGITSKLEEFENRNWFSYLFKGPKLEKIEEIDNDLNSSREKIAEMRGVAEQAPTDEIKGAIESGIISLEQSVSNSETALENIKKDLSFWRRLKNIF